MTMVVEVLELEMEVIEEKIYQMLLSKSRRVVLKIQIHKTLEQKKALMNLKGYNTCIVS